MRTIKNILLIITLSLFIISCSNGLQGFKLKKTTSGDEFLIQKKDPLVQPPDYTKLPNPDEENNNFDNEETQIEKVFKNNNFGNNNEDKQDSKKSETSLEKNILKKIQNQ